MIRYRKLRSDFPLFPPVIIGAPHQVLLQLYTKSRKYIPLLRFALAMLSASSPASTLAKLTASSAVTISQSSALEDVRV